MARTTPTGPGQAPVSDDELRFRAAIIPVYRARRIKERMTLDDVGARLRAGHANPGRYVYRFERGEGGNFGAFQMDQHAKVIGFSLAQALVEAGYGGRADVPSMPTVDTMERDSRIDPDVCEVLVAAVRRSYEVHDRNARSALLVAKRRDEAKAGKVSRDDALAALTDGWPVERRQALEDMVRDVELERAAKPAAPRRRAKKVD